MSVKWVYTLNSDEVDEKGQPIQYWFIHTVGTLDTVVHMATNKYWWEGDKSDEASGILLEPVMPIKMHEPFLFSTPKDNEEWQNMCQYWLAKN